MQELFESEILEKYNFWAKTCSDESFLWFFKSFLGIICFILEYGVLILEGKFKSELHMASHGRFAEHVRDVRVSRRIDYFSSKCSVSGILSGNHSVTYSRHGQVIISLTAFPSSEFSQKVRWVPEGENQPCNAELSKAS